MIISTILKIIDTVLGILGLILMVRIVLQIFHVSSTSPVMRFVKWSTDPILNWIGKILGINTSPYVARFGIGADVASALAAVILLWITHSLVLWLYGFVGFLITFFLDPLGNLGAFLTYIVSILFSLYNVALLVRVILEWLHVSYSNRLMRFLWNITEPVLVPIRRVVPPIAGWDLSPVVAFFLLSLLQRIVVGMLSWIF